MPGPPNTQFALGVHLLTLLAGHPQRRLGSEAMTASAGSNPVHVRRVLGQLRRAGLVHSRSGPHGGWRLAVDPEGLTLDEVFVALHGDRPLLGLHGADPDCPVGRRLQEELVAVDQAAQGAVREALAQRTIAELARCTCVAELALEQPLTAAGG